MGEHSEAVLRLAGVSRVYGAGPTRVDVFANVDLALRPGEIVALLGPSGSGKSSLLHIAGLLEKPSAGEVAIAGTSCARLDDRARTRIRRLNVGFVYQFHHLLPEFSALENVIMPQLIAGASYRQAEPRARELLSRLQMDQRMHHRPAELSGGEQQRVAIARALANRPLLLLADEPTGNLDPRTAAHVHGEFLRLIRGHGLAALVATHNHRLARDMDRIVHLENGALVDG